MGRRFKREGIYVYLWLIHTVVWHYKAIILQLKINFKKLRLNFQLCMLNVGVCNTTTSAKSTQNTNALIPLIYVDIHGERELGKRKVCLVPQWEMRRGEEESSRLSVHHTQRESVHEFSVTQSCLVLCNPMDYNLPGSSVHGISQARILEWVATSVDLLHPEDLPEPRTEPRSPILQADSLPSEPPGRPILVGKCMQFWLPPPWGPFEQADKWSWRFHLNLPFFQSHSLPWVLDKKKQASLVLLDTPSTCQIHRNSLLLVICCHLLDNRVLGTGAAFSVEPSRPPSFLPGNSPGSFWRFLMVTQFK